MAPACRRSRAAGPPRWLERLIARLLPAGVSREGTLGDLAELWHRRAESSGRWSAHRHYVLDLLAIALRYAGTTLPRRCSSARRPTGDPHHPSLELPASGHGDRLMATILHDIRFALRALAHRPTFTVAALATLGLGIGANTAVFAVVNAVLLSPLPFEEPERMAVLWGGRFAGNREVEWLREHTESFTGIAGWSPGWGTAVTEIEEPVQIQRARISSNALSLLGVEPILGRTFVDQEGVPGGPAVVVVSHRFWQNSLRGDPAVIGTTLSLDLEPHEIVGVLPPDFGLLGAPRHDAWTPLPLDPAHWTYGGGVLRIIARLARGVTFEQATRDTARQVEPMRDAFATTERYGRDPSATPIVDLAVGNMRTSLLLVLGSVGCLLLIAGANLGNLLLARTSDRRREIVVRFSLGAGRGRLIRQLLTESVVLSVLGGALGLALAYGGVAALRGLLPPDTPGLATMGVDGRVLGACTALSLTTGLLFGLTPALTATRERRGVGLVASRPAHPGGGRLRSVLVIAEVALALVLLVGAGLMLRTIDRLHDVDPGFRTTGLLTMKLHVPGGHGGPIEPQMLYEQVRERVAALPGVESVATTLHFPIKESAWTAEIEIEDRQLAPGADRPQAVYRSVGGPYFETTGIPLLAGRVLDERDVPAAEQVVVINRSLAELLWPGADPIGRLLRPRLGVEDRWCVVVGVVGDVRPWTLRGEPQPILYRPAAQVPQSARTLVVRSQTATAPLVAAVRATVRQAAPDVPVADIATIEQVLSGSVRRSHALATLLGTFAAVGLALGLVGIYGVTAYTVGRRTHEIGLRMALGATSGSVLRLVVGQGLRMTAAGVVVGLLGGWALTRWMQSLVFEVSATDPVTFGAMATLVALVGACACYLPARRAATVSPTVALRDD